MKYFSTRGKVQAESFEDVLFSGFTSDGGLYMPERIPVVDECTLQKWKSLSYMELVSEVTSLFIPPEEIPPEELKGLPVNLLHPDISMHILLYCSSPVQLDISLVCYQVEHSERNSISMCTHVLFSIYLFFSCFKTAWFECNFTRL